MTIDLDALEQLAKAATPGPWRIGAYPAEIVGDTHVCIDTDIGVKVLLRGNENFYEEARANAGFSAAANPATILELIAEVRRLREDAERISWIEGNWHLGLRIERSVNKDDLWCVHRSSRQFSFGKTAREAIDAARSKEKA